jgi:hypothetical protein
VHRHPCCKELEVALALTMGTSVRVSVTSMHLSTRMPVKVPAKVLPMHLIAAIRVKNRSEASYRSEARMCVDVQYLATNIE